MLTTILILSFVAGWVLFVKWVVEQCRRYRD